jgi:hypothetical protein
VSLAPRVENSGTRPDRARTTRRDRPLWIFRPKHGADDEQVPLAEARALYGAVGSKDKTFRIFTPEEGGAQHCMRDYLTLGVAEMWNWLEDRLLRDR